MAEIILSATVEKILGQLASPLIQEVSVAWGLEAHLKTLQTTVSSIKAVLSDAEEQRFTNHKITLWLRHLRHALSDVDDVLDDFAYQALRSQVIKSRGDFNKKVRHFFSSSITYRLRIGHKVKNIRKRLDEINANKEEFNLNERVDRGEVRIREREMTNSLVNASKVIGREGDREAIVKFLIDSHSHNNDDDDNDNVSVIPIVGIGGLGKTTLAKIVSDDERVVKHFETKVWVCLGDVKEFNVNNVMAKIIKAIFEHSGVDVSSSHQLENVVRDKFRTKRFLLVLDDMWDASRSGWLELKGLLASNVAGSKVLVTTRIHSVAQCVSGTFGVYNLEGLPHDECVFIFKKLAFVSEAEVDENLMRIGDEIVRKCKSVPLAVRTLASHLFSKRNEREWISVRDNGIWKIDEEQNDILAILKFSYDHLSSRLKQCFVYCSIFPEDHKFREHTLISYWMAHGLLDGSANNEHQPEDVGKQYINEFLSRGFFQDFHQYKTWWCEFKMHDLVAELARSLSQNEFQILGDHNHNLPENVRHVWIQEKLCLANSSSNIRSVLAPDLKLEPSVTFLSSFLAKFNKLRFLSLSNSKLEVLPDCIGNLKHLRSLDLTRCESLEALPNSICKLHNLQTLSLLYCISLQQISKDTEELVNLRWLCVSTRQKHLPKNGIESLSSLQFLWFHRCWDIKILLGGSRMDLTSLKTLIVDWCPSLNSLFGLSGYSLPALEVLELVDCEKLDLDEESKMTNLKSLKICRLPRLEVLPDWIRDCARTLQYLEIKECDNFEALPEWMPDLTSLRTLRIRGCFRLRSLPGGMDRLSSLKEVEINGLRDNTSPRNWNWISGVLSGDCITVPDSQLIGG